MSDVYLRDLKPECQGASFLGEGIEALKEKAEELGHDLVVGKYLNREEMREANEELYE